ncbi:MAG: ADP-ribosylglycohydrolase family protein [Verrucomicrobia bacterium]|nr:ADP-ribosylglycohydrolase family protein [Verrucomicrobiota bacterium]
MCSHAIFTGLVVTLGLNLCVATATAAADKPGPRRLSRADLSDKIRGGWAGQMIGVAYGAPTEFRSNGKINDAPLDWAPGRIANAIDQDDLYVEMTFAKVMDTLGLNATCEQYGEAFRTSQYRLWHANAGARRALHQGIKAPWSGHPKYNIHANDIDFQIEADFIGLMCPGLPREVNRFCDRVGRVMNYGDGLYGGMFVCGMYAAAFFENDPRRIVEAGWACIPAQSGYGRLIRDLLGWSAQHPNDWRKVWQLVQDKWDKDDPCPDGALAPFNIDARLNGAYIAFGLLFGGGDFLKTLEISTRCGQDSDCNPSSAAGVLGVQLGYSRIPDEFKSGIPALADKKFQFTDYSFKSICESTERRALAVIARNRGKITQTEIVLPYQAPKAPKLEQWDPGVPYAKLGVQDAAWTWSGPWSQDGMTKVCQGAGGEATLRFNGVAVALMGRLNQAGGRADIYLDGKKAGVLDAYIVERTHDNTLWHIYGLKPGDHTLRLVTTGTADARSQATTIAIDRAVLYRPR